MIRGAKANEITLVGAIFLIAIGIFFIANAHSDTTGIMFVTGIIMVLVGIISLVTILMRMNK